MNKFRWQGKDFGAWLTTIARNLIIDHYKSGRVRLEVSTDDFVGYDRSTTTSPEDEVMRQSGQEILRAALRRLPPDQQDCLVLRFLNGSSLSETALALSRSEGAVKQLQLRALRGLAKLLPGGLP
ncbi:MAG: sigma-70 family RNA polymerase sigma factor [Nocardioidaceae bacterium]